MSRKVTKITVIMIVSCVYQFFHGYMLNVEYVDCMYPQWKFIPNLHVSSMEELIPNLHVIDMSLVLRKPVFGVTDQVRHKPGCTVTEDG